MTPRVAIACSGLGDVRRGNETWAATVAEGIHKSGGNVILFGGGEVATARSPYVRVPCWRRDGWLRKFFSWDKAYLWEQVTFARNLRRHLRRDRFDIVHTADPNVAQQLIAHSKRSGVALIYQDSLLIGSEWCGKFEHVQVLAPAYAQGKWRVIPQMVDTKIFSPKTKAANDNVQLLAVGDFSAEGSKRLDWVIDEVMKCRTMPRLTIAGQAQEEDLQLLRQRGAKLGERIRFLPNVAHAKMPEVFQEADLFVHAATREPFGLVLIEAMACGLPVVGHEFEVTKWIAGAGGRTIDMTRAGALANAIDELSAAKDERGRIGREARARAVSVFDKEAVLPLYHAWHLELALAGQRA